ncbi:MAG TPA: hypothetical protein VLV83_24625 [Acidobacteriota bacterium]|nr:hypothetical protein [Acidobacteriota bacterium]
MSFYRSFNIRGWLTLCLAAAVSLSVSAADDGKPVPSWPGPADGPLPFESHEQVLNYLKNSKVVSSESIGSGTNDTRRLTLSGAAGREKKVPGAAGSKNRLEVYAVFRNVDIEFNRPTQVSGRFVPDFRDSYIFEVAAYRLSRLLQIDQVPPAVLRRYRSQAGSVQLWIYGAISETKRRQQGQQAPDDQRWTRQVQTKLLFDRLINNLDRNLGNQLIDRNWKLWLIDHTRSFGASDELRSPQAVYWCSERVYQALKTLDREKVRHELRGLLRSNELKALFNRWDKLTAHLDSLIQERGREAVLF